MTAAELAELILHGDPDDAVAALMASGARFRPTADGTAVTIPLTAEAAERLAAERHAPASEGTA